MDLLNSLLEGTKGLATQVLTEQVAQTSGTHAGMLLDLIQDTVKGLDSNDRDQLLQLFKQLALGLTDDKSQGAEGIWETFKESPLIKQWAETLTQTLVKRLTGELLSS